MFTLDGRCIDLILQLVGVDRVKEKKRERRGKIVGESHCFVSFVRDEETAKKAEERENSLKSLSIVVLKFCRKKLRFSRFYEIFFVKGRNREDKK